MGCRALMDSLHAAAFFAVTVGHFLLTPYWLKRAWGPVFASPEEFFFHSIVVGFGSLQAVLHLLACTVGISLPAGIAALVGGHLCAYLSLRFAPRSRLSPGTRGAPTPAAPVAPRSQVAAARQSRLRTPPPTAPTLTTWWKVISGIPWVGLIGATALATLVLSWLYRSPQSDQILGIDSFHYHVPYAVNYAHGTSIFGYLATPHLYAVGGSILGAWFYQAFADLLLLDLINLLPFVLLVASLVYLFWLLTGESGWEWATVIVLLLLTGKMFRVSLFISADMLYAASFVALFAAVCSIWARNEIRAHDWLSLSLSTGMLLSSKPQGLMSAGLLILFALAALAIRSFAGRGPRPRLSLSVGVVVWSVLAMLASGGIWPLRNWVNFGSPLAPVGLQIFGIAIFPGASATSDWLSVVKDMRDTPGYSLVTRFLVRSQEWVGTWPAVLAVGLLALLIDAGYQLGMRRQLAAATRRKLFALALFVALFGTHGALLMRTGGSSIEILGGQTLRYLIPFFALYPVLAYALLFADAYPWVQRFHLKWIVLLPGLAYLLYHFNAITQMPGGWNRMYGSENLLDYRLVLPALAIVAPWCVRGSGAWEHYAPYGSGAVVALLMIVLVQHAVAENQRVGAQASARFDRELRQFEKDGRAPTLYRSAFYRGLVYQRRNNLHCERSRYFTMSRFDFPLQLQDPAASNLVLDVQDATTRVPRLLRTDPPGHTPCDFIIAVHTDSVEGNPIVGEVSYPAVSESSISELLRVQGTLEPIGDAGRYRVYHVRGN